MNVYYICNVRLYMKETRLYKISQINKYVHIFKIKVAFYVINQE